MNQLKKLDEEINAFKKVEQKRAHKKMRGFLTLGFASFVLVGVLWKEFSLVPGVECLSDSDENASVENVVATTVTTIPEITTEITTTTPITTEAITTAVTTVTTEAVTTEVVTTEEVTTEEVTTVTTLGPGFDYEVPEWIPDEMKQFPMVDSPLNTESGVFENGPMGKETYYNLNMDGVLDLMYNVEGYSMEEFPYWERAEDGAKMFGPYIMVAANLDVYPKGTILDCSMGKAMVCDLCGAAYSSNVVLDIAVTW